MSVKNGEQLLDDGLITPSVGLWAEKKYSTDQTNLFDKR
jgi:hypothetical protein